MLSSPITITIDGVGHQLVATNDGNPGMVYLKKTPTMELRCVVRHAYEGKTGAAQFERHNVDLTQTTWDVDGKPVITQCYTVFRTPRNVDSDRLGDQVVGFNTFVSAQIAKLVGWES